MENEESKPLLDSDPSVGGPLFYADRFLLLRCVGAVDEHVLGVELIRRHGEKSLENNRKDSAAEPLEHAVLVADALRNVAPE